MQQQIGFCTTADGVRIAYATVGAGPALVVTPLFPGHLGLDWEEPRVRGFWEDIGRHHLVVRYDRQGCGLSDRNRTDFSLECEVGTIGTIVKELRLKSFALLGYGGMGGAAAIPYAVKFPDHLSHLILCGAQAHGAHAVGGENRRAAIRALGLSDFRMASLAVALAMAALGAVRGGQIRNSVMEYITRQMEKDRQVKEAGQLCAKAGCGKVLQPDVGITQARGLLFCSLACSW